MIRFDAVTFRYQDAEAPALADVTFDIPEGELCLVLGATGSGKSTLLRLVNGLAPHFTGGTLSGTVSVDGLDTRTHPPRDLARRVGVVGQDPLAGFVTDRVEDELAYSMEQLGVSAPVMRQRVEEVIDLLGLDALRERALSELSAGEQQRVAIGAALTAQPRVLVLDEPTSALDPGAAEEVLAALLRLVHDLGVTVLLAEHRLERVIQYADSLIVLGDGGSATHGAPAGLLATSPIAPPIVELGRLARWMPLPLSVRDARRRAEPLRDTLAQHEATGRREATSRSGSATPGDRARRSAPVALSARRLRVDYPRVTAVDNIDLDLEAGEIVALMGRNGSGKTSLLWALQGSGKHTSGTVRLGDATDGSVLDPESLTPEDAARRVVLVPQNPSDLLYLDSVSDECREADRVAKARSGTTFSTLQKLSPGVPESRHPRDLSEGQRLALVLAIQLASAPRIVLLDEPTRGLDYDAKARLSFMLAELAAVGTAVLLSSHDVEFVARTATRVVVLARGEVITMGSSHDVLTASASFAPQVSRILRPLPFLTVDEVADALTALDVTATRAAEKRSPDAEQRP